jgi:competence protein ComFC
VGVPSPFLEWVYPSKCGLCGLLNREAICEDCRQGFRNQDSSPRELPGPVSLAFAIYAYEDRASQAVRRLKYSRTTSLAGPLADMVRTAYDQQGMDRYDLIVPIPIHWRRRAFRGFNQAEELASQLPIEKLDCKSLRRIRFTRPQVGLDLESRKKNLVGAFRASPSVAGKSVLLIDDVTTSGHTAEQCALALLEKGATQVGLLALTGEVKLP